MGRALTLIATVAALACGRPAFPATAAAASESGSLDYAAAARLNPPIELDRVYDGALKKGGQPDVYRLILRDGQAIVIEVNSRDFDTLVEVYAGDTRQQLAMNDDFTSTNSRLLFARPANSRNDLYYVVVRPSLSGAGDYSLSARRRKTPAVAEARPLPLTGSLDGVFNKQSPWRNADGSLYETYALTLAAGQRVEIGADSDEVDTRLEVTLGGTRVAADDDSGSGFNPLLFYTATTAGRYEVAVLAANDARGAYKVRVRPRLIPKAAGAPTPISLGYVGTITFAEDSPILSPTVSRPIALYTLTGKAGERVVLTAEASGDVATAAPLTLQMQAGADTAAGFAPIRSVTGSIRTGVRVPVTFTRDGEVTVRVIGPVGAIGAFRFLAAPPAPPNPATGATP